MTALPDAAPSVTDRSETPRPARGRFLRRPNRLCRLLAVLFLASCAGAVGLLVLYHCPRVTVLTFFVTTRPALVWFALLFPVFVAGAVGVRSRWAAIGLALGIVCLLASDEGWRALRPGAGGAREEFQAARMGFESYAEANGPEQAAKWPMPLRIISWNVDAGLIDGPGVVRELEALRPDLVILQEYARSGQSGLGAALAKSSYFADFHRETETQALLSRYPVTRVKDRIAADFIGHWQYEVYRVHLAPNRPLIVLNFHLSRRELRTQLLRGWSRQLVRNEIAVAAKEIEGLRRAMDHYAAEAPVLVAGDFNLPGHYAGLAPLRETHADAFRENGFGWGRTAPTVWRGRAVPPAMRVDMIWVPKGSRVYSTFTHVSLSSDHAAVVAEAALAP